ncbi:MAG: GNAT family N-acyltransferase, partial [Polyangiales bacterium]
MSAQTTAVQPNIRAPKRYPIQPWDIPDLSIRSGAYRVRFAQDPADVAAAQRLRFQVFNLELGEGLQASYTTGRDEDDYDQCCHHLLVELENTGRI